MTVALLPGLRGDPAEFCPLLALLPSARLLGLPASLDDTLAAIAARLPDADLIDVDVIIGASFGGLVARALVASGRTRATLVLVATLPHPLAPPEARRCAVLGRLVPLLPSPVYRALYGRRAAQEWAEDADSPWSGEGLPTADVLGARLRAIAAWGLPPIPTGTVCVWGERDRFATWTEADVRGWGGVPAVLAGGHRPHLSHPDRLLDLLG